MDPLEADDPRVIGDFRLQARLGAGGMGRVYLGFSPAGRAVAVKVIHPHLARDPSFASRFQREVAAAQAVNAVYAAPVVAAGPDDTPPWLATAFVPAPSLQDVVATAGPLPEDAVWKLAAGLAEGLRAVHASGLVHRDLKPGNVLMAADGPRLIDFGIAQMVDGTRLTTTGGVLGTPSYMSPEQARGDSVDGPSDIFSLGGVVYFAATGQPPFGSGMPAALLYKIVFGEPTLDGLSPQLRSLVGACLDKNPATRPTPAQLATALMPAMPDQFTPSRVAFWPEPVERFINDYRARLDQGAAQVPQGPGTWPSAPPSPSLPFAPSPPSAGGWRPAGEPTVGRPLGGQTPAPPLLGATTARQRTAGGRHARGTVPVAGMSRRHALAALAGAATAGLGIGGWEVAAHAGTGKPAVPAFSLPKVTPGKVAWKFNANANVASIVQSGNVVYASTNGNAIFAVNATTGKLIWKRTTTSELNQALAVVGKNIVVSGGNGPFGMAGRTGKQTWYIKQEDGSFLLAAGRVVYAGFAAKSNTTGGVTALDPATGTILWTYAFGPVSDIGGQMVVEKGTLYVATGDTEKGELWAFSAANGGVRRRVAGFPQFGAGTLAVINGVVYAGLDDNKGTVVAVNMASGKTLWQKAVGAASFPPYMATTNGILFAGTVEGGMAEAQTGSLYALNAKTGDPMWSIPIDGGVNSGPIAAPGVVYTAGGNQVSGNGKPVHGILEAWQPTGKKLWSYASKDFMGNMTVVPGSRVYVSGGGYLYSLGA